LPNAAGVEKDDGDDKDGKDNKDDEDDKDSYDDEFSESDSKAYDSFAESNKSSESKESKAPSIEFTMSSAVMNDRNSPTDTTGIRESFVNEQVVRTVRKSWWNKIVGGDDDGGRESLKFDSDSYVESSKWSMSNAFTNNKTIDEKVRGVMKLQALTDSVILILDKNRKKKFCKKYPDVSDIIDMLMHAKIDTFLSQLPFLLPDNGDTEHNGLGILSSVCKYEAYDCGEPIFVEGDIGDKLYIILKGSCAVLKGDYIDGRDGKDDTPDATQERNDKNDKNDNIPGAVSSDKADDNSNGSDSNSNRKSKSQGGVLSQGSSNTIKFKLQKLRNKLKKKKEEEGTLSFSKDDVLATLTSGNYFGEMAVMVTMPRSSTVVASERTLLLTVSKNEWREFLLHHDKTRKAVELHMKSRLMGQFSAMNISFFENITKQKFEEMSPQCDVLDLKEGQIVMNQGERGDKFFVIISGRVSVTVKAGVGGPDAPKSDWQGELIAGQYFGEIALVMDTPRKATVTCLEGTVLLSINKQTFNKFFDGNPRALAEIQLRLLGERAELHSVLANPQSLSIFKEFLKAEHSEENIVFWEIAVDFEKKFKKSDSDMNAVLEQESNRTLPQLAEVIEIWDKYLQESSDLQVNISSKMRQEVEKLISMVKSWSAGADVIMDGTATRGQLTSAMEAVRRRTIFMDSKDEIYKLMVRDSYPRFKKHGKYCEFIKELGLYSTSNNDQMSTKLAVLKNKGSQSPQPDQRKKGSAAGMNLMSKFGSSTKDVGKGMRKMADRAGSSFGMNFKGAGGK
jgi:CRP-like cAMP-binding protein